MLSYSSSLARALQSPPSLVSFDNRHSILQDRIIASLESSPSSTFSLPVLEDTQPLLKLVFGSCYVPKDNPNKPLGEDAHFVCQEKLTFGVADGVGGWAKYGIDAGEYSRQLMSNALTAVKKQPHGDGDGLPVDLRNVLNEAYSNTTTAQGSSTACLVTLSGQSLHAINVSDSGFRVIRKENCVYGSPVQQKGFNCPYQLGSGTNGDDPTVAHVFDDIPVKEGDVVVLGTDGVFDNVFDCEIILEVEMGMMEGVDPEEMACRIAEMALDNSSDTHTATPFAEAARKAGFTHNGGKIDDITVVVAYVVSSQ